MLSGMFSVLFKTVSTEKPSAPNIAPLSVCSMVSQCGTR